MGEGIAGRVRLMKGIVLAASALCTSALFLCAGGNAVSAFTAQESAPIQETTAPAGLLTGLVIALDPGHGGYDGGAVGRVSGTPEKGLNLDVANRTRRLLMEQGAAVVLTRTDDYALCDENPPIRKKLQDMQRRAALIEENGCGLVLSIHMNEYAGRSESGPQVFYREGCPAGRLLAGAMQEAMIDCLQPRTKREALGGDYYILTLGVPSVLIECGFLSNREEEALLLTGEYREKIAASIVQGVLAWAALEGEKPQPLEKTDRSDEPRAE
ncbi:MAG: N-acetylmuramoyl-L-alanine amidase [Clostridia bacterium]|nr:N-acetylmuramoyl-L-alanine amidase [Clostridia bacterium]